MWMVVYDEESNETVVCGASCLIKVCVVNRSETPN